MKIICIFPKDSEALFNKDSTRTFGGANVQMYMITKELGASTDNDIYSFIPNYGTIHFDDSDTFNLIKTFNESDNVLKKFFTYHKKIRKIHPDAIIQRGLTLFSCLLAMYCYFFKIKFVFMFAHDIESEGKYQGTRKNCRLFKMLTSYSYRLIAQNEYEFENLKNFITPNKHKEKVKILKKGLEFNKIISSDKKEHDFIWIARCEQWKHPEIFINTAQKYQKFNFVMVCSKVPGNEEYFEEVKKSASMENNILFFDFINNNILYELIARTKIFCISSDMEGDWPMTVLESAATGLPIVSLNLNYGNLLSHYMGGFYCEGSIDIMEKHMIELTKDKKLYDKCSKGAKKYIRENHDIKINVRQLLEHIG